MKIALPLSLLVALFAFLGWRTNPERGELRNGALRSLTAEDIEVSTAPEPSDGLVPGSEPVPDESAPSLQPFVDHYRNAQEADVKELLVRQVLARYGEEILEQLASAEGATPELEEHIAMELAIRTME